MSCQSLEDVVQLEEKEEEDGGKSQGQGEEQEAEDDGKDSEGENPLEKYMKMVLEARGQQQEKVHRTLGRLKISARVEPHLHLHLHRPLVVFAAKQRRRETLEPGGQDTV